MSTKKILLKKYLVDVEMTITLALHANGIQLAALLFRT